MTVATSVTEDRASRGLALYRERGPEIVWNIDGTFSVPSRSREGLVHEVDLDAGMCSCEDATQREILCGHVYAAELKHSAEIAKGARKMADIGRRSAARRAERIVYSPEQSERLLANLERMAGEAMVDARPVLALTGTGQRVVSLEVVGTSFYVNSSLKNGGSWAHGHGSLEEALSEYCDEAEDVTIPYT
jgi:hypothetical protein